MWGTWYKNWLLFCGLTIRQNLVAQTKLSFETKFYYILFQENAVYRVLYSQYENLNIRMWEKWNTAK